MMSGPKFKNKIKSIAEEVTIIEFLDTIPDLSGYTLDTNKWDVSDAQNGRVMAWYEETTLRIGANGPIIANKDCSNMFYFSFNNNNIKNISFGNNFDTSNVTDMRYMFSTCNNLTATITLRSNVTSYNGMFNGTSTQTGAKFTLNYTSSTASIIDSLIATKSSNSNVVKGIQVN